MMRRLLGVIIGFLLFFPGAMILRWLVVDELRLYQEMTLTDALLAIIIILATTLLFGQPRRALTADELEAQAKAMELASRRLEEAQRRHQAARRGRSISARRDVEDREARLPTTSRRRVPRTDGETPRRRR